MGYGIHVHEWKVYFGGTHQGSTRTSEAAAVLCRYFGDGATVKAYGRICWKQGVVACSVNEAAALMDSCARRDDHGDIIRKILIGYRGPVFSYEQMLRSIKRKQEATQ